MRSPADMKIIQLEATNACEKRCSACTRLVPHVKKPWFMSFEQFAAGIKSMEGWPGLLGFMGGNPVLHPEFEKLVTYFMNNWGPPGPIRQGCGPILNFPAYVQAHLGDASSRRGLWTSLGAAFYRHLEVIQDCFSWFNVNTHENDGLHQGLLISRADFNRETGQSDDQWLENRDNCWVQTTWSASINPRGAYFCEVAAAIDDLLFEGKSAWPVESGWWKREPSQFNDQLHLCNYSLSLRRDRPPSTMTKAT